MVARLTAVRIGIVVDGENGEYCGVECPGDASENNWCALWRESTKTVHVGKECNELRCTACLDGEIAGALEK